MMYAKSISCSLCVSPLTPPVSHSFSGFPASMIDAYTSVHLYANVECYVSHLQAGEISWWWRGRAEASAPRLNIHGELLRVTRGDVKAERERKEDRESRDWCTAISPFLSEVQQSGPDTVLFGLFSYRILYYVVFTSSNWVDRASIVKHFLSSVPCQFPGSRISQKSASLQ